MRAVVIFIIFSFGLLWSSAQGKTWNLSNFICDTNATRPDNDPSRCPQEIKKNDCEDEVDCCRRCRSMKTGEIQFDCRQISEKIAVYYPGTNSMDDIEVPRHCVCSFVITKKLEEIVAPVI